MDRVDAEFEAFVAARYAALVRAARLLSHDPSLAEDLAQAALIRTYTHWRTLQTPAAAEKYTRTTLVRLAIRAGRRKWRAEHPAASPPDGVGTDEYAALDTADMVRAAVAGLPTHQRAVLVLRYYLQLSEAETAAILRCPVGTVKSRANRALRALRQGGLLTECGNQMERTHE